MLRTRVFLVAALALAASCKSDSNGPVGLVGTMSFGYSGGISGTFSVSGQFPLSTTAQETTAWAAGALDAGDVIVGASSPRTSTSHDGFALFIERNTAGTATIGPSCTTCADLFVDFGAANGAGSGFLQACFLEVGTVTITEITATRVKGTFSGTGTCIGPPPGGTVTTFTVTNGTFDVALVPNIP